MKYVYKMEANPCTVGMDDRHFIQAYEPTAKGALIPEQILFLGSADICMGLLKQLNNSTIQHKDFFAVKASRPSNYTTKGGVQMDALVGLDDKIYLGRSDHYDQHGHYLNDDKSLMYMGSSKELLTLLSGDYVPPNLDVKDHGTFVGAYTEFTLMQHDTLADFVEIEPRFSVEELSGSKQRKG